MREPSASLSDDVVANAAEHGADVAFSRRIAGCWQDVTWAEFLADVAAVAKGLLAYDVQAGDRVALLSKTRYEWTVVDYAIWFAGAVTVPLYDTADADQIGAILGDSGATVAVVETADHRARVERAMQDGPIARVVCLESADLEPLVAAGRTVSDAVLESRRAAVGPDALATIIYTSGTTGRPKGCRLTHRNFRAEIDATTSVLPELFSGPDPSTLLFLPMAHVLARVVAVGCVHARVRVGHTAEMRSLGQDLEAFRPSFLFAVPRVFEKLFDAARGGAASDGRGAVFDAAVSTAVAYSQATEHGRVGPVLRGRHAMFDRVVYARLRRALGGRLQHVVSGGAPLGDRLAHFFRGAGISVLEGYGLTETTAALTVNRPGAERVGTVGQAVPGTTLRIADDGEVLAKGPQVFDGYWADQPATDQALVAGWLHTGDIGEIDDEGYLRITGRLDEILVTAGGKNVAPSVLEDRVRAHPLVSQCLVVGDGRPYVAALVTIDRPALKAWRRHQHRSRALRDVTRDADLLAAVQEAIDAANAAVSRAESIRAFAIVDAEWTERGGELTPTLKLRRRVVMRSCHDQIEALYS